MKKVFNFILISTVFFVGCQQSPDTVVNVQPIQPLPDRQSRTQDFQAESEQSQIAGCKQSYDKLVFQFSGLSNSGDFRVRYQQNLKVIDTIESFVDVGCTQYLSQADSQALTSIYQDLNSQQQRLISAQKMNDEFQRSYDYYIQELNR